MHIAPLQVKQQQAITLPMSSSKFQKWLWLTILMSHTSLHEEMPFPSASTTQSKHLQWPNSYPSSAIYAVHHHEILNRGPHTVRVQEVDRMHSNIEKLVSVSECFDPISFYCKSPSSTLQYNMYQTSYVLSVHPKLSSPHPTTNQPVLS